MRLLVQCGEKPDWLKLRQTVRDYCCAVIPGPIAMDVVAITKGRGKGKSKHKYESHGDGGKGKKGKKGKQAKNSGKSKGHDHFDGHCLFCGKWGHQQKDCWFRKTKGHQVNHVSQDGQVASSSAHQQTSSSSASVARCDRPLRFCGGRRWLGFWSGRSRGCDLGSFCWCK